MRPEDLNPLELQLHKHGQYLETVAELMSQALDGVEIVASHGLEFHGLTDAIRKHFESILEIVALTNVAVKEANDDFALYLQEEGNLLNASLETIGL